MPAAAKPRDLAARRAAELLRELAALGPGPLRVTAAGAGLACVVQVWPTGARMPTARAAAGGREQCRCDVAGAVRAAGRPLTRKEVVRALKAAGTPHGAGTVAKALADLTGLGVLVNRRDGRGYRLPGWLPPPAPSLFDVA